MSDKFVEIKREDSSGKDFPVHQVSYHGKLVNALGWYGYGVFGNPGDGTLGRLICVGNKVEQRIVVPEDPKNRPTTVKGESGIFNPGSGSHIIFKADGSIEITSTVGVTMNAAGEELIDILAEMVQLMHDLTISHSGTHSTTSAFQGLADTLKARIEAMKP